ncbi:MAG: YkgJ family cysteine cluster protein [Bdellovibrionales bacterium]
MSQSKFYENGIRFECQGSGKCCVSHGGYGNVYLTLEDRRRMAKTLGLKTSAFSRRFCEVRDGIWRLKDGSTDDCVFLKNRRCSIYEGRPTQCRTWPFWPEVLNARTWNTEVKTFCPGVGKGRVWESEEIDRIRSEQETSEANY